MSDRNAAGRDGDAGEKVHGVVKGPCPKCSQTIPRDTLTCPHPHCGYRRSFDQEQYDILSRPSGGVGASRWNQWRDAHDKEAVRLECAYLAGAWLPGANLQGANLFTADLRGVDLLCANLEGASLPNANLEGAKVSQASLAGAKFPGARMENASLYEANLERANLHRADLTGADLRCANLTGAMLTIANLGGADLSGADLKGAELGFANVQGAHLGSTNLRGVGARMARVDGGALISNCPVDDRPDFTGVGLGSARIDPSIRARLEYNIRRFGWRDWYKSHALLALFARPFWLVSDYGRSTRRILLVFALLSVAFAAAYYVWALAAPPGAVEHLTEVPGEPVPVEVASSIVPFRALYFSVVTMTTLGFGDMHACPGSLFGHLLLTVQVVLGYVLLGALITRFAIMFQGVTVPWERKPPPEQETDGQEDR